MKRQLSAMVIMMVVAGLAARPANAQQAGHTHRPPTLDAQHGSALSGMNDLHGCVVPPVASPGGHAAHASHGDHAGHTARTSDSAFAALQARGREAMGVDQYTSTHQFDSCDDGGRIELQRDSDDAAGIAEIRQHLQEIAEAFASGDFSTPTFVHMLEVPGARIMAAKRDAITYTYRELPRGGELRLVTTDPEALEAIHAFMAFQRQDHRAGGVERR